MTLVILLLVLLIVVPAFLPRRLMLLAFGVNVLLLGLLLLDMHTTPSHEDGDRTGFGILLLGAWILLSLLAYAARLAKELRRPAPPTPLTRPSHLLLSWPLPVGVLVSVLAMHWLSNRLAGASPAWLVHVAVFAAANLSSYALLRPKKLLGTEPPRLLAAIACFGLGLLVLKAAMTAPLWVAKAREQAGSRPFCLLAFAGRDRPRAARATLELSPLVSRSGGRSFADDAAWLVIEEGGTRRALSWQSNILKPDGFRDAPHVESPACRPGARGQLGS